MNPELREAYDLTYHLAAGVVAIRSAAQRMESYNRHGWDAVAAVALGGYLIGQHRRRRKARRLLARLEELVAEHGLAPPSGAERSAHDLIKQSITDLATRASPSADARKANLVLSRLRIVRAALDPAGTSNDPQAR